MCGFMHVGKLHVESIRVTNILTAWLICSVYIIISCSSVVKLISFVCSKLSMQRHMQSILIHPLGISDGVNMNMFLIVDTGNYTLGL